MNTKLFLGILMVAFFLASCGSSGKKSDPASDSAAIVNESTPAAVAVKKYPIKSAIVTFENDMLGIKEKTVLYFDDYGIKEAEEKYEGEKIKSSTLCDGKNRYIIVQKDKAAYIYGECSRGVAYKFDWEEISKADQQYKAKKLPNETVAGKDCQSYSFVSGGTENKFAGWNNICLLTEQNSKFGKIIFKAVKVEENATIPTDKLTVPAGFEIKKSAI